MPLVIVPFVAAADSLILNASVEFVVCAHCHVWSLSPLPNEFPPVAAVMLESATPPPEHADHERTPLPFDDKH